jgi:V/A-type H+-transporting ATPase subunit B
MSTTAEKTYLEFARIEGPIVVVEGVTGVGYGEIVEIQERSGRRRTGQVLEISDTAAVVQVFEGTQGLATRSASVRFLGRGFQVAVGEEMLGRVFDGLARPIDGAPEPVGEKRLDVNGLPMNPASRRYPRDFIQTGVSAIDGLDTLVRGQKLPIFSGAGLPHNRLAAQIVRQAKIVGEDVRFAIIFAGMGLRQDEAAFFRESFEMSGALANVSMFLNMADDPSVERIITPRAALTLAEFLAFEKGYHILVVMTDMTNYAEAMREIASAREEIPSRKGYPGYLYSDLAALYERTGRVDGSTGSITQLPVLTMPNDDITHPIPDLTGYITEGQIVLGRDLHQKGVYPPIFVLPSLSRLMKDCIGKGRTRDDHPNLASQLYALYAAAQGVRSLASIVGEEELSETDRRVLEFSDRFEREYVTQGEYEDRPLSRTLDIGWSLLSNMPKSELTRVRTEEIDKYLPKGASAD